MSDLEAEYGEFARLAELRIKLDRMAAHGFDKGAVLILPADLFEGATAAYGLPIVRAEVPEPMLGIPGGDGK